VLDGETGFWQFFGSDSHDDSALLDGLGSKWQILNTTYKPWPSCRWTQYPLTAFLSLKDQFALQPDAIDRIIVRANPFAQSQRFKAIQPDDMISAEFSHAHVITMAAFDVPPGPDWYSADALTNARYKDFRGRVSVELDPRAADLAKWIEGGQFRRIPASVEVHTNGSVLHASVDMALGDPWSEETRLSDSAIRKKFIGMVASDAMAWAEEFIETIDRLESINDVNSIAYPGIVRSPT
jgi:2-methylcitrate dehydratase PrpD